MRSFDPLLVGTIECAMWVAYYRRQWWRLLVLAIALVRHAFALPRPAALYGAWLILRANQLWAPRDNDPDGARRVMRRFYALVARRHGEHFDRDRAARLEVDWWRAHRESQHDHGGEGAIVEALVALYAHVYAVAPADVRDAARQRVLAMRYSDRWIDEGCPGDSELVDQERAALVRAYAALLCAVHVV